MNKKNLQDSDLRNFVCIAPNHIMYSLIECRLAESISIADYNKSWIKFWNLKVTTIEDLRNGWLESMGPPPVYPESRKK